MRCGSRASWSVSSLLSRGSTWRVSHHLLRSAWKLTGMHEACQTLTNTTHAHVLKPSVPMHAHMQALNCKMQSAPVQAASLSSLTSSSLSCWRTARR